MTTLEKRMRYEIDSSTTRAMCKITPVHLAPNAFQKMSCKLAIQIFSRSVSAVIKTCMYKSTNFKYSN